MLCFMKYPCLVDASDGFQIIAQQLEGYALKEKVCMLSNLVISCIYHTSKKFGNSRIT